MHTPFAVQPADDQDPRNAAGDIPYDEEVTLLHTWQAMERLVGQGKCRAIGLSDTGLDQLAPLYEAANIEPSVIQVEAHPCRKRSSWISAARGESCCWPSPRWVTGSGPGRSKILSRNQG